MYSLFFVAKYPLLWPNFKKLLRVTKCLSCYIIGKFSHASLLNTKLMSFRAYCSAIYGCQLWSTMFQYSYSKLRVAYNDAFRQLLHEPRWCSASRVHNVSSFSAIIRKLVYSLLCSLRDSNNLLVCAMLHSNICLQSSLFER